MGEFAYDLKDTAVDLRVQYKSVVACGSSWGVGRGWQVGWWTVLLLMLPGWKVDS